MHATHEDTEATPFPQPQIPQEPASSHLQFLNPKPHSLSHPLTTYKYSDGFFSGSGGILFPR